MGYYYDGTIRCFTPDNTATELYIDCDWGYIAFDQILSDARKHFGNPELRFEDLMISAEHINTRCIGYDRYDNFDYTNYLVIKLAGS